MENLFNPTYRKHYSKGYVFGQNPVFSEFEDISQVAPGFNNDAFKSGFESGRTQYERMNGKLSEGIPTMIITDKLLEEFKFLAQIGMTLEIEGFTLRQLHFINQSRLIGESELNPNQIICLFQLLALNGISL